MTPIVGMQLVVPAWLAFLIIPLESRWTDFDPAIDSGALFSLLLPPYQGFVHFLFVDDTMHEGFLGTLVVLGLGCT